MQRKVANKKLIITLLCAVVFAVAAISLTAAKKSKAGSNERTYDGTEVFYVNLANCGNSWWTNSGCYHRAYFFGTNSNWVSLSETSDSGIYKATVPAGSYYGVILARCSTDSTTWSSGKVYNQTGDIMIDSSANYISYFSGENNAYATWDTYTDADATETPAETETPTVTTTVSPTAAATASADYNLPEDIQDGVILHAFNWSYDNIKANLQDIAEAGYTAVQTSPVQQPKDYNASYTDVGSNWWKLYQPLSISIAENSWLGNASDLASLCAEAEKYDIKIICDIVVNHLANDGSSTGLCSGVATYEPTIYNNYSTYIHPYYDCYDSSTINVVYGNIGMPDLNTGNTYVQDRVISLLKQCIDCGVDGFRFDAAKHIETSDDGSCASNFWNNVIGTATSYASSAKGIDLFCYGEILNTPGDTRSYSSYTSLMSVIDNKTGDNLLNNVNNQNAGAASSYYYYSEQNANKLVIWAESHDTYEGSSGSGGISNTSSISTSTINKTWAIAASRVDAASLYFARPGSASMGNVGTTNWKDDMVVAVNQFHNKFVDSSEWLSYSGSVVMNERYYTQGATNGGAVLVNVSGTSTSVSNMTVNTLGDGEYTDALTNNKFTVSNGKISGDIGSTGVAVIY